MLQIQYRHVIVPYIYSIHTASAHTTLTSCSMVAAATVGHILSMVTGTMSRYMELNARSSAVILQCIVCNPQNAYNGASVVWTQSKVLSGSFWWC